MAHSTNHLALSLESQRLINFQLLHCAANKNSSFIVSILFNWWNLYINNNFSTNQNKSVDDIWDEESKVKRQNILTYVFGLFGSLLLFAFDQTSRVSYKSQAYV